MGGGAGGRNHLFAFQVWKKVDRNWGNNMIRISKWEENHCRIYTSVSRNEYIQKRRTVRVTIRDPSRKIDHVNKIIWARKLKQLTRSIISTRICYLLLLKSPKTNTLADRLIERTSSVWDKIASTVDKKIDGNQEKETEWNKASGKHKNRASFLEISPVQKEVPSFSNFC